MNCQARSFVIVVTTLLTTVWITALPSAAATGRSPEPRQLLQQMQAQQLQLQAQVQAQQLQLQTQVEGLKKQLDDLTNRSDKTPSWAERYLPVTVSIIAAALSCLFFVLTRALNKEIAKRTVTIEAQKLLVEINKQYLSNPALFAIYDDLANMEELSKQDREALQEKIRALGYMKLNIFELVYDVLPDARPWKAYFENSLKRCKVLRDELDAELNTGLYNEKLIRAYNDWRNEQARPAQTPTVTTQPTTPATPRPQAKKGEN